MRQRNDTDYALLVGTDPVCLVEPGEEIDHEHPVAGFTAVDETPPEPAAPPAPQPEPPAPPAPPTARKVSATPPAKEATQ